MHDKLHKLFFWEDGSFFLKVYLTVHFEIPALTEIPEITTSGIFLVSQIYTDKRTEQQLLQLFSLNVTNIVSMY